MRETIVTKGFEFYGFQDREMIFNYEKEPIYPVAVYLTITILTHPEICITKAPWQKDSI